MVISNRSKRLTARLGTRQAVRDASYGAPAGASASVSSANGPRQTVLASRILTCTFGSKEEVASPDGTSATHLKRHRAQVGALKSPVR